MVGKPGAESSLRRAAPLGNQQIPRQEDLQGLGHTRTMNQLISIVNLSGRGDKDVAQAADKIGLQMPK
jgi:hypothetical protein